MGLLLPRRWPVSYSQWWECEFITEGVIDNGESSPLLPGALPWAFSCWGLAWWVTHCDGVPTLSRLLCKRQPHSAHVGQPLHLPYAPSAAPAPWRGGALARSCGSASGPSVSGTNQPLPPLQVEVFGTACRTCRRSCVPAWVMSPCPCPSSCAPPTRFGTLLSACPSPGRKSSRAWGLVFQLQYFGVLVLS